MRFLRSWVGGLRGVVIGCLMVVWADVCGYPQPPAPPELPREFLQTDIATTPVVGKTVTVAPDGDLQAALEAVEPGDEIVLEAGAVYAGNFLLPDKGHCDQWITVRTSDMGSLTSEGVRVRPEHATAMPRLVDPTGNCRPSGLDAMPTQRPAVQRDE